MIRKTVLIAIIGGFAVTAGAVPFSDISFAEHTARQRTFRLFELSGSESLELSYVDVGPADAPVILLVHGVPTSSWSYRHLIESLVERGYRVISPDNLGFGNSSMPDDPLLYDLRKQASRLLKLMDGLSIDHWTQVLHDVGGPITWEMLMISPDHIERLVLLNTFAYQVGWHPPESMNNELVKFAMKVVGFHNRMIIRNTICDMIVVQEQLDNPHSL